MWIDAHVWSCALKRAHICMGNKWVPVCANCENVTLRACWDLFVWIIRLNLRLPTKWRWVVSTHPRNGDENMRKRLWYCCYRIPIVENSQWLMSSCGRTQLPAQQFNRPVCMSAMLGITLFGCLQQWTNTCRVSGENKIGIRAYKNFGLLKTRPDL